MESSFVKLHDFFRYRIWPGKGAGTELPKRKTLYVYQPPFLITNKNEAVKPPLQ